jgi:transcriptional regulator with XRE-family HTH domain
MTPQKLSTLTRARIRTYLESLPSRPTQKAIGDAIGRTQTWVSHYLSGRHDVDLDTLSRLCAFLRVDLSALVADRGELRHTVDRSVAELLTLFDSLTEAERETVLEILRALARRPSAKRARR